MTLTQDAIERITWAEDKGILDAGEYTAEAIAEIVAEQDIVSMCSTNGTVSFDIDDLVFEG